MTGFSLRASQAIEQAPGGVLGSGAVGSKQGTHAWPTPQPRLGRNGAVCATSGRQVERQRPSAPAIERQVLGTQLLADEMIGSGAQKPPGHAARRPRWS